MAKDPTRQTIRNMVALQRLANGLADEARRDVLVPLFDEIAAEIARLDPGSETARVLREARLDEIMEGVQELSEEQFNVLQRRLQERLEAVGVQQGRFAGEQLIRSIGPEAVAAAGITIKSDAATPGFLRTIIEEDPFGGAEDKKILAEWAATQDRATVRRVRRQVQLGMANGEALGDIVRRIRGTQRGGRFVGGVLEATTRETEAIARTAINHVATASRQRTFDANEDILSGVEFVGVLDSRTTLQCSALDSSVWPVGSSEIEAPPIHFGCRSTLVPVIDWEGVGIDPPEGARRPSKRYKVENGELVELDPKQVSQGTGYADWFKDQPAEVQDEIIGPTRAKLFRSGKVDFRDMVTKDNRVINVTDLDGGEDALKAVRGG